MGLQLKPAAELGFGLVDEGTYTAKMTGYTKPEQGKFGLITRIKYEIQDDDEFEGSVLEQLYGIESKKFFNVVKALAGGEYPDDGGDLNDYIGSLVSIVVEQVEKNGDTFSNVTSVLPARRKKKATPKPTPIVEDDDSDDDWVE